MRAVEMEMFHEKFKFKDSDTWSGSNGENRAADKKIAGAIRSSLMQYEKNPKAASFMGKVFKFK